MVYANSITKSEVDDKGEKTTYQIPYLKEYKVFNVNQIIGLPESFYDVPSFVEDDKTRLESVNQFIAATKAVIQHGGDGAFYNPTRDFIQMPLFESFQDVMSYYAALAHELTLGQIILYALTGSLVESVSEILPMPWKNCVQK